MRIARILIAWTVLAAATSCDVGPSSLVGIIGGDQPGVRIINAFNGPVDVLVDGTVALSALAPGEINTAPMAVGSHTLVLRPTGGGASISEPVTAATGALSTIAATVSAGVLAAAVLDDTNSVVPSGATKLRVLHLAPNAGTLQVYRTQPDYQTPVSWQFPFNYEADPTSLSAPFYQSTVGAWDVRVWQTPADSSGWSSATARIVVPLQSGAKATVVITDNPGGGVRVQVI
jgi:uncharacterized protein DUF4397